MVWLESGLNIAAYAATIIGTFRAGSRVLYLSQNSAIGIVDGPLILPPTINATANPVNSGKSYGPTLYELSEAFRDCVGLSLDPQKYWGVRRVENTNADATTRDEKIEGPTPYSLSPFSKKLKDSRLRDDSDGDGEIRANIDLILGEIDGSLSETQHSSGGNSQSRKWFPMARASWSLPQITLSIRSQLEFAKDWIVNSPMIPASWVTRATSREDGWNEDRGNEEEDSECSILTHATAEGRLLNNSTKDGNQQQITELSVISPDRFANLRSIFGISDQTFEQSMLATGPFVSFQSNSKGAARVGGVFFFTRDGAYMIKTIKTEEAKALLRMLPKYHEHMKRFGRDTLLTRICGMYGVRIRDAGSATGSDELHTIVVMNSVFPAEASRFITERFDLKGSTVGRQVSEEERRNKGANAVLKDLDLAQEVASERSLLATKDSLTPPSEYGLHVGPLAKASLMSQLRHDVKLLVEAQVMDYSLLVGVVDMASNGLFEFSKRRRFGKNVKQPRENKKPRQAKTTQREKKSEGVLLRWMAAPVRLKISPPLFCARRLWTLVQWKVSSVVTMPMPYYGSERCGVDGGALSVLHGTRRGQRAVYYMGLIDFLQPWTTRKVLERQMKGLMGYDRKEISCVTPEEYASRFLEFIDAHVT